MTNFYQYILVLIKILCGSLKPIYDILEDYAPNFLMIFIVLRLLCAETEGRQINEEN